MHDGEYEDTGNREIELAQADATDQYACMMREWFVELTVLYDNMNYNLISGRGSEEEVNKFIAKMLSIMINLLPKVDGGGDKTKELKIEFDKYKKWIKQVQTMKIEKEEMDKIPDLYYLIVRAYNVLGLSSI